MQDEDPELVARLGQLTTDWLSQTERQPGLRLSGETRGFGATLEAVPRRWRYRVDDGTSWTEISQRYRRRRVPGAIAQKVCPWVGHNVRISDIEIFSLDVRAFASHVLSAVGGPRCIAMSSAGISSAQVPLCSRRCGKPSPKCQGCPWTEVSRMSLVAHTSHARRARTVPRSNARPSLSDRAEAQVARISVDDTSVVGVRWLAVGSVADFVSAIANGTSRVENPSPGLDGRRRGCAG